MEIFYILKFMPRKIDKREKRRFDKYQKSSNDGRKFMLLGCESTPIGREDSSIQIRDL